MYCHFKWRWNSRSQLRIFDRKPSCVWLSANCWPRYKLVCTQQCHHLIHQQAHKWFGDYSGWNSDVQDIKGKMKSKTKCNDEFRVRVKAAAGKDARVAIQAIPEALDISSGSLGAYHTIWSTNTATSRSQVVGSLILLWRRNKRNRVAYSKPLVHVYDNCDSRRLHEAVTGDETWLHC